MDLYTPILVLGAIAAGFAVVSVVIALLVGPRRYNRSKLEPYECGIEPLPEVAHAAAAGQRFPIKYYLTAMLFIIFDIEIVFLYPYATVHDELGSFGVWAILVFSIPIVASYAYEIGRGGLEWGPAKRLRPVATSGIVSAARTTRTTIRRVGLEGREPVEAA